MTIFRLRWPEADFGLGKTPHLEQALDRLSEREAVEPFPPNWHWELRGQALYGLGRYEEAASTFARMTSLNYWGHGAQTD